MQKKKPTCSLRYRRRTRRHLLRTYLFGLTLGISGFLIVARGPGAIEFDVAHFSVVIKNAFVALSGDSRATRHDSGLLPRVLESIERESDVAADSAPMREAPELPRYKVVRVIDGDTVDIRTDRGRVRVRLRCIDAPESKQYYGWRSRWKLSRLVGGETVRIAASGTDRYGRLLAILYHDDTELSANWHMIREGAAWDYRRYTCGYDYRKAEQQAREKGVGLWKKDDPTPPWEWRRH